MSKPTVTIACNAINAKLHEALTDVKLAVQMILSYKVEGAEESAAFKSKRWDGKSSFFNYKTSSFPAGFLHFVSANLRKQGYVVNIVRKPLPEPLGPVNPKLDNFPEDPRYDYQMKTVDQLLKHGQIIAQIATGGGKSRTSRLAYARINRPSLFLTTRSILMHQMREDFERDLGVKCSVLGDGHFGEVDADGHIGVHKMCVGMVQTLVSRLEETTFEAELSLLIESAQKKFTTQVKFEERELRSQGLSETMIKARLKKLEVKFDAELKSNESVLVAKAEKRYKEKNNDRLITIKLLERFEFVILEEAHEASGESYYQILRHCKNAHYRLALTGTPFMKDSEESNMKLMACSGPIAIKVSEKMLIDRGILAKPYFKNVQLKTNPPKLHRATGWQSAYRLGITSNDERNNAIVYEVSRAKAYGLTSMILVTHTSHGDLLRDLLKENGIRADFIRGENDQKERKLALKSLSSGEIDVLIGTTILDVGVDVPAVGMIVLAGGGKAEVSLRQRIGRGLRAKKVGPNVAFVVDFSDHFNSHTKNHATQRYEIIRRTEGFGENIVPDFDFDNLGFSKI